MKNRYLLRSKKIERVQYLRVDHHHLLILRSFSMNYIEDLERQWNTWPQIVVNFTEPSRFDRIHFFSYASFGWRTSICSCFTIRLQVDTVGRLIVDEENKSANFFMWPNMFPYDTDRHFHSLWSGAWRKKWWNSFVTCVFVLVAFGRWHGLSVFAMSFVKLFEKTRLYKSSLNYVR